MCHQEEKHTMCGEYAVYASQIGKYVTYAVNVLKKKTENMRKICRICGKYAAFGKICEICRIWVKIYENMGSPAKKIGLISLCICNKMAVALPYSGLAPTLLSSVGPSAIIMR